MTREQLQTASTAAYEAHMASGLIVETHRDLLEQALEQQKETRRVWLMWSNRLHEADSVAVIEERGK